MVEGQEGCGDCDEKTKRLRGSRMSERGMGAGCEKARKRESAKSQENEPSRCDGWQCGGDGCDGCGADVEKGMKRWREAERGGGGGGGDIQLVTDINYCQAASRVYFTGEITELEANCRRK